MSRAVVLLSGGLDSTTTLAIARHEGLECYALTASYGQLHQVELEASRRVADVLGAAQHRVVEIDLRGIAQSALTDESVQVPKNRSLDEIGAENDVPATYVPARNTILLGLALAWAETVGAQDIFVGVNVLDASGYPDCRPAFIDAFQALANVATREGTSGRGFRIRAPLIEMTKAEIIRRGQELGLDYSITHSCYAPGADGGACGACDACALRAKGFAEASVNDPTRYTRS